MSLKTKKNQTHLKVCHCYLEWAGSKEFRREYFMLLADQGFIHWLLFFVFTFLTFFLFVSASVVVVPVISSKLFIAFLKDKNIL